MDEIPTSTITWLIVLFCVIGASVGGLFHIEQTEIALGVITGFLVVWYFFGWLMSFFFPRYKQNENTAAPVIERIVLSITVDGVGTKLIHGLTIDEIHAIGRCVTANDAYTFNVQHFKQFFGNSNIDGYSLYTKCIRWFKDLGALVPNAKGGVDVTEIGEQVFTHMRDGTWEELKQYEEPPYSPA